MLWKYVEGRRLQSLAMSRYNYAVIIFLDKQIKYGLIHELATV